MSRMVYTDTPQSGQTQLPAKLREFYDRNTLENAVEELLIDAYASQKSLPKFYGDGVRFSRYERLPNFDDTPLVEGIVPASTDLVKTDVETASQDFGQFIEFTDKILVAHEDGQRLVKTMSDELGKSAGESQENLLFKAISGGSNIIYADGCTDDTCVINSKAKLTTTDLKVARLALRNQLAKKYTSIIKGSTKVGTQPIPATYIMFAHPDVVADLENLVGWKAVETYAGAGGNTLPQEVGSIDQFRVIETTLVPIDDSGSESVYKTFGFGMDSFARVSIRGKKAPQFIFKNVGSAGSNDPLDQLGSSGVRFSQAGCILNNSWLVELHSTSSFG